MTDVLLLADIPSTGYLVGTAAQRLSGRSKASEETGRFLAHLEQRLQKTDAVVALYPSWQADGAKRLLKLARGVLKTDRIAGLGMSLPPLALSLVADQIAYLAPYLQPGHLVSVAQNLAGSISAGAWTRSVTKLEHIDTKMGHHLASYLPNETFVVTAAPAPAIHRIAGHKVPDIGYRPAAPIHLLITQGDATWFQEGLHDLLRPGAVKVVAEQPLGSKFWGNKKYVEFVAFSGHPSALSQIANATRCWQCRWCGEQAAMHVCAFCGMSQEREQAASAAAPGWTPTPAVAPRPARPPARPAPAAADPPAHAATSPAPAPAPQTPAPMPPPAPPAQVPAPTMAAPPPQAFPPPTPAAPPAGMPPTGTPPAVMPPAAAASDPAGPTAPPPLPERAQYASPRPAPDAARPPGVPPAPAPVQPPSRRAAPLTGAASDRRVAGSPLGRPSAESGAAQHQPQYAAPDPGSRAQHRPPYSAASGATHQPPQPPHSQQPQHATQPRALPAGPSRASQNRPPYTSAPPAPPTQSPQQAAQQLRSDPNWNGRNSGVGPTGSGFPAEGSAGPARVYGQSGPGQISPQYPASADTVREAASSLGSDQTTGRNTRSNPNWTGRNQGSRPPRPTQPNGHPQGRVSP